MRFTVFTHVAHQKIGNEYYGYAPYIREMNIWLKQFETVEIVAPITSRPVSFAEIPYRHEHLTYTKIPAVDLLSLKGAVGAVLKTTGIVHEIFKAMKRTDHIHLRCPGNIGLIACLVQVFFPKKPKTVKYAGNWNPKAKQPWSYKLQKWLLNNTLLSRNIKVLVYGEWPDQSKNIIPFFTASFSKQNIPITKKSFQEPYLFLFVGNLVLGKRPLCAIKLVEKLWERNLPVTLEIYGNGILEKDLEKYCLDNKLMGFVCFKGSQRLSNLKKAYQRAHFLLLFSKSEGWPKAVAEAMFFGCVPAVSAVSCVPWMLGYGERGVVLEDGDGAKGQEGNIILERIINLMKNPEEMKRKSSAAKEWSQNYSLEKFEEQIKTVLK